ncbi:MAG: hypothetical protein U0R19_40420 [Bryobacteraceae bacterium]
MPKMANGVWAVIWGAAGVELIIGGMSMSGQQERLESWKQIAAYLGKSERTVRRWQQDEGMPVHRHQHQQRGSVWAFPAELDGWLEGRRLSPEPLPDVAGKGKAALPRWTWGLAAAVVIAVGIWIVRPSGTRLPRLETVPLTSMPGASYGPSVSPDGKRVAFQFAASDAEGPQSGIYIKTIGTEGMKALVYPGDWEFVYGPAWSPDGKTIAFLRRIRAVAYSEGGETWLHVVSPDGGADRRLLQVSDGPLLYANHMHLSWTPDSEWIVTPMAVGGRKGMHRVSLKTGEARQLTVAGRLDYGGQLSPDGRALAFLRQEGPPGAAVESVLRQDLAADGTPLGAPKTLYQGRSQASGIAWTPSGKDLVFCNSTNAFFGPFNSRLFLLRAEPGHAPQLLESSDCSTVTVSRAGPSGKALLVYASGWSQKARMHIGQLDSLDTRRDFAPSTRFDALPQYSPDGRQVAFLSNRDGTPKIWVARRDGSEAREVGGGITAWSNARWAPDGKQLLFGAAYEPGSLRHGVFVVDVQGGKPERIAIEEPYASNPFWSADGRSIYYWGYSSWPPSLWKVSVRGGRPALIGQYPANFQQQSAAAGDFVYYSRNQFPFVLAGISLSSGKEVVVTEMLTPYFAMAERSLYFVRQSDRMLCSMSVEGGAVREHSAMPAFGGIRRFHGVTVSPSARSVIWAVTGDQQSDLQMVADFRL